MKKELLAFCRTSAGKTNAGNQEDQQPINGNAADNNALQTAEEMEPVEDDWDSDSDDNVYFDWSTFMTSTKECVLRCEECNA